MQNPANSAKTCKIEPKFKVGDEIKFAKEPKYPARKIIAIKNDAYYFDELVHLPFIDQDTWELVKQKPAWSKEDEKMLESAIWHVSNSVSNGKSTDYQCQITDWLKSLKPQNKWKPTVNQLGALRRLVNTGECFGHVEYELLQDLYEELEKL